MGIVIGIIILVIFVIFIFALSRTSDGEIRESRISNLTDRIAQGVNRYTYHTKEYFFSYSEKEFYTNLKKVLFANYGYKYEIFPKVRLADIFDPENENQGYKRLWMRHIDFLITDSEQAYRPILAIELDGSYHKQYRQYQSDQFKNKVFKESNLPLIRFNNSISNNEEIIRMNITQYLGTPTKQNT